MKSFAKKLLIFLIPAVIAVVLFFAFEPYDYFGLKHNSQYLSKPLSTMREVIRDHPANIILGDSQMANLNTGYIEELTGTRYTMLGFGGSRVGECIDLFWFAAEHTRLEKVVFGVNFYSSGGPMDQGRIPSLVPKAENPFRFISGANYWLQSIDEAKRLAVNCLARVSGHAEWITEPEDPTSFDHIGVPDERGAVYRKDLEEYSDLLLSVIGTDGSFHIEDETMNALGEVIDYCNANGIEIIFVFPPMQESVFDLVTEPYGIDEDLIRYKQYLSERATVYDLCYKNAFTVNEDNFYDGLHLAGEQKKTFAELIFTDIDSDYVVKLVNGGENYDH